MKNKYDENMRQTCIKKYCDGISVQDIAYEFKISRSTIYRWIKENNNKGNMDIKITKQRVKKLENKVARLSGIVEILKKVDCNVNSPLKIKLYELEKLYGEYSVHMLCDALEISRGTFYNHMFRNKKDNTWYAKRKEELRIRIKEIYDENRQIFGVKKITAILKKEGYHTTNEMVRSLMRDMGLISIRQEAKDIYDKEQKKYKNYLNQEFNTNKPNEVWVSDITYFKTLGKAYYICVIIDLFARRAIGYKIGRNNSTQLVKSTFKIAYESRNPGKGLIFHTDRGGNYRSNTICEYLKSLSITQSYSKAHVPYDNSVMELFFASMKKEELYRTKYRSENEFRTAVDNYIIFYNEKRPHAKNKYMTPLEKEQEYYNIFNN